MRVDKSVIVLFRQMNLFLNRELLDEKLTSSDVLYLALLYEQDGRTQDEMAEAYTVDRAATTRSLQGLEKKGLVRREVDTFDRRIRRSPPSSRRKSAVQPRTKKKTFSCVSSFL